MEHKFNVGDKVKCSLLHGATPVYYTGEITRTDGAWLIINDNLVVHENTATKI